MGSLLRRGLIVALLAVVGGCARTVPTPQLGLGPIRPGDPTVYEDAIDAARLSGHGAIETDREHGRFVVRLTSDPTRRIVLVVQCSLDGYLSVTPTLRGEPSAAPLALTREQRTEYARFVLALESAIPEAR